VTRSNPARASLLTLAAATLLAAAPVGLQIGSGGLGFAPAAALAKHGADDRRPDDRGGKGRGADQRRNDDRGRGGHGADG
jgi:hypothetical protein